jgi:hypothetical protein
MTLKTHSIKECCKDLLMARMVLKCANGTICFLR